MAIDIRNGKITSVKIITLFIALIGIQLIKVLKEIRAILLKVEETVESFEKIGTGLETGFGEVSGFFTGIKSIFKIVDLIGKKKNEKREKP